MCEFEGPFTTYKILQDPNNAATKADYVLKIQPETEDAGRDLHSIIIFPKGPASISIISYFIIYNPHDGLGSSPNQG